MTYLIIKCVTESCDSPDWLIQYCLSSVSSRVTEMVSMKMPYGECFQKCFSAYTGFYTKLIVWGSLGLNFEYDGGPIIEIGGPIFLYKFPEDRKKQSLIRLFSN